MLRWVVFIVVSAGIVHLSRKSLRNLRSHGCFRFFALECVLGLFLLNMEYWFHEPFSIIHIISWLLLLSSLVMVVNGFYLLRKEGRPKSGIENTTMLVRRGIYKYIRHPLYSLLFVNRQRKWHSFGAEINGHLEALDKLSSMQQSNTEERS